MFTRRPPLPGAALLLVLLFSNAKVIGSDAEEATRPVGADAVSANQRAAQHLAAAYHAITSNPQEAHEQALEALRSAEGSGDPQLEHKALVCLGTVEEHIGLLEDRLATAIKALRLSQGLADPQLIARDLRALSEAYLLNGMGEPAVMEARNALAILLPTRPIEEVEDAELFLIRTLKDAGQVEEARDLASSSLSKVRGNGSEERTARFQAALGAVLVAMKQFPDAIVHLTQAQNTLSGSDATNDRFEIEAGLVVALLGLERTTEAKAALNAASIAAAGGGWIKRHRVLELRYLMDRTANEWRDAVASLERIKQMEDSVRATRTAVQFARFGMGTYPGVQGKVQPPVEGQAQVAGLVTDPAFCTRVLIGSSIVLIGLVTVLLLNIRKGRRMAHRLRLKNEVVKRQHDEIRTKHLELQRQNLRMTEALMGDEEKELVIKEIHHRVKNNLQVVDSLLQLQAHDSNDPGVARVIREAQGRIRSMALVHEQIYRTSSGTRADLRSHIEKLGRNILVAYGAHDRISVQVRTDLPAFHMECLLPFTLVLNELFTNAVKYAFANDGSGRITIVIRPAGAGYELLFHDDGLGLGTEGEHRQRSSFGLELVSLLAEQMNGRVRYLTGNGTTVHLTFMPDASSLRAAS
ncbi:MAG: sensor histidine kinase [Flavobacteriales bacterium]|jgi:two-component sensor histidine kinase|nr:sensor histidine kinase [Flavobacteriales bacterium]